LQHSLENYELLDNRFIGKLDTRPTLWRNKWHE